MDRLSVETSQHVTINYLTAGAGERILASLLDGLIAFGYIIIVMTFLTETGMLQELNSTTTSVIMMILYIPVFFYHLLFEIFMDGQSPGKKFRNTKVVQINGGAPGIGSYLLRWLLLPIDIGFFGIGVIFIIFHDHHQRLGDLVAGTTVVKLNTEAQLQDTILRTLPEDYEPSFPQAKNLKDEEVQLINKVLNYYHNLHNKRPLEAMANKLMTQWNLNTEMGYDVFLHTIIKDYNYYARQ